MHAGKHQILNLTKYYATLLVAFLFSFLASSLTSSTKNSSALNCANSTSTAPSSICSTDTTDINVSVSGSWTISVSSAGILDLDITPTSTGTLSTVVDNVNVYTNTPNGYQLYLNSTTNSTDIYNSSDIAKKLNHFTSTTGTKDSPTTLTNNTWGYSLDASPTTFSKVPLVNTEADSLISTGSKTTGAGDNLPITFGFKADTGLSPGTYATQITYTAIADAPSYAISSISPTSLQVSDQSNKTITFMTTTPATELGLGDVTAKIGTVELTNCSEITSNGYRGATCTYTGSLPITITGYNVELTSSWHNATYSKTKAFYLYQGTMQNFTQTNCNSLAVSTTSADHRTLLKDSRDDKLYSVSRLADGNCWMVSNLALDGGRTLTPADSNVTTNHRLAANISDYTTAIYDEPQIFAEVANQTTSSCTVPDCVVSDIKYGNLYNWNAATATVGKQSTIGTIITESVCPKNWRLPDRGTTSGLKSYSNLLIAYGLGDGTNQKDHGDYVRASQSQPLWFALSGYYSGVSHHYMLQSRRSYYWYNESDSASDPDYARFLYIRSDPEGDDVDEIKLSPLTSGTKAAGRNIRCVFGS